MAGEQIEAKAVELIGKLEALAPQVGPAAWEAAMWAVRAKIVSQALSGLLGFVIVYIGIRLWRFARSEANDDEMIPLPIPYFFAVCVLAVGFVLVGTNLLDGYLWVGLYKPEIWLAKKALGL